MTGLPAIHSRGPAVRLDLRVSPRASRNAIDGVREGRLVVKVTAPPVDAAANDAVIYHKALIEERVIAARRAGIAWRFIGEAMGNSHQAVIERFGRLPEIEEMDTRV